MPRLRIAAGLKGVVHGVGGRDGMEGHDPRLTQQQLAGAAKDRVPNRLRGHAPVQRFDDLGGSGFVGLAAQHSQQFASRPRIDFPGVQVARQPFEQSRMLPPRPIRFGVPLRRIFTFVHQQRVCERPEHRFGVLPADELQRTFRTGHEDRLVPDGTEVPAPKR